MEVEGVESGADGIAGPLVVGRVLSFEDEPQKNGKTIRWCQVDVGEAQPRGIVCGASNFAAGDLVVVSLPGAVLPGGFAISARKTYGHVSDGMICSTRELGIGDEHDGILVLPRRIRPARRRGTRRAGPARCGTRCRGDHRPRLLPVDPRSGPRGRGGARTCRSPTSTSTCPTRRQAYEVTSTTRSAATGSRRGRSPISTRRLRRRTWMVKRLRQCGVRSISLAVDVTNYVMLETGQPLHAFDRAKLTGAIGVRRAQPRRAAHHPGRHAHPRPRRSRGHRRLRRDRARRGDGRRLHRDQRRRPAMSCSRPRTGSRVRSPARRGGTSCPARPRAGSSAMSTRRSPVPRCSVVSTCSSSTATHGRRRASPSSATPRRSPVIALPADPAGRDLAGMPIERDQVIAALTPSAGTVDGGERCRCSRRAGGPTCSSRLTWSKRSCAWSVTSKIPSVLPIPHPEHGLTREQALRRAISRAVAAAGLHRGAELAVRRAVAARRLRRGAVDDPRRAALRLVNPLSDAEPELRTSLLPGLLATLQRNLGRGNRDLAIFEMGLVFRAAPETTRRPSQLRRPAERRRHRGALRRDSRPAAPSRRGPHRRHRAARLVGQRPAGHLGRRSRGRPSRRPRRAIRADRHGPAAPSWHPGRCAELLLGRRCDRLCRRAAPAGDRDAGPAGAHVRDGTRPRTRSSRRPPPAPVISQLSAGAARRRAGCALRRGRRPMSKPRCRTASGPLLESVAPLRPLLRRRAPRLRADVTRLRAAAARARPNPDLGRGHGRS